FVTLAKKAVFGRVGIDALNGPSEGAIIADGCADPALVAADLLAQDEHDPEAVAILFTPDPLLAEREKAVMEKQLPAMERASVVHESLEAWGAVVTCRDLAEAAHWVNAIAPEHVQLMVAEPWTLLPAIRFAGAIFMGPY